ncbi:MAG: alpha/beta hydrolase fold domain-containing protein, partial [Deltaproteobacteria bacterium]|nr:alpha/beta hydrolase fold domain-containing protein [Deltaproteobacteria bacterium]
GLAAATLLALKARGAPLPAAAWLLSPAVDLADQRPSWEHNLPYDYLSPMVVHLEGFVPSYLGDADPALPLASPIRGDLAGLPPLLIHVGEREVLHDQVAEYARKAQDAGVDVQLVTGADMVHVYPAFVGLAAEADQAFRDAGQFMQAHVAG